MNTRGLILRMCDNLERIDGIEDESKREDAIRDLAKYVQLVTAVYTEDYNPRESEE